jgi:hypothetical protein
MEHILIHRIDKKHWAALNHEKMLVPIAEKEFQVLEDTEAVRFCIVNTLGLRQVHLLDMARQVYEYGWTTGLAIQDNNVWNWDVLSLSWILNGLPHEMAIITGRGEVVLHLRPGRSKQAKLCGAGHWNTRQSRVCRHCKEECVKHKL